MSPSYHIVLFKKGRRRHTEAPHQQLADDACRLTAADKSTPIHPAGLQNARSYVQAAHKPNIPDLGGICTDISPEYLYY